MSPLTMFQCTSAHCLRVRREGGREREREGAGEGEGGREGGREGEGEGEGGSEGGREGDGEGRRKEGEREGELQYLSLTPPGFLHASPSYPSYRGTPNSSFMRSDSTTRITVEHGEEGKEVEYYFASDARCVCIHCVYMHI